LKPFISTTLRSFYGSDRMKNPRQHLVQKGCMSEKKKTRKKQNAEKSSEISGICDSGRRGIFIGAKKKKGLLTVGVFPSIRKKTRLFYLGRRKEKVVGKKCREFLKNYSLKVKEVQKRSWGALGQSRRLPCSRTQ